MLVPIAVRGAEIEVVTIVGCCVRLDEAGMNGLGGNLVEAVRELAALHAASTLFKRKPARQA